MEVHQLKYFVAVTEEGSFSRAAARLRLAQPSLSQQIQKLEGTIGRPLFDRLSRGVIPTEAGRRLLVSARKVLAEIGDAQRSVSDDGLEVTGTVAAGIIPTIAPYILRPALAAFRAAHPDVAVTILEDTTDNLVRSLEDGAIDLAIVSTCESSPAVNREVWGSEPLLLAVRESHRLARRKRASWRDLAAESILMLQEGHCLSRQISRWCSRHHIRPQTQMPALQISTLMAMVATGQGLSLIPAMAVSHEQGRGCAFVPFGADAPERQITLIRNPARYRSKASTAFAGIARDAVVTAIRSSRREEAPIR